MSSKHEHDIVLDKNERNTPGEYRTTMGGEYAHVAARSSFLAPTTPPFGVYRVADPIYQVYVNECLVAAQADAQACIHQLSGNRRRANRLIVNDVFATTVVQKQAIQSHEGLAGVRFDRVLERLGNLMLERGSLAVPVAFAWLRNGRDAIVGIFDRGSSEYTRLLDHREQVRDILTDAGLPDVVMRQPHHVSIASFGEYFGPDVRASRKERDTVLQVMKAHLLGATVDYVELGATVAGSNYTEAFTLDGWLIHVQQQSEVEELVGVNN